MPRPCSFIAGLFLAHKINKKTFILLQYVLDFMAHETMAL